MVAAVSDCRNQIHSTVGDRRYSKMRRPQLQQNGMNNPVNAVAVSTRARSHQTSNIKPRTSPSGGGETNHFLFVLDPRYALGRRQKSFFHVFRGALNQLLAASQTELVFD